jgi:hypothetical protein
VEKINQKPERDAELAAIWAATPTCDRYTIDGVRHVLVKRDGRGVVVPLKDMK